MPSPESVHPRAQEAVRTAERLQHAVQGEAASSHPSSGGGSSCRPEPEPRLSRSLSYIHTHTHTPGEFCTEKNSQIRKMTAVP